MGDDISGWNVCWNVRPQDCWAPWAQLSSQPWEQWLFSPWFQQSSVPHGPSSTPALPALAAMHLADLGLVQPFSSWLLFPEAGLTSVPEDAKHYQFSSFCAASASNIPALGWGCLMFTLACRLSPHLSGNVYYLLTHVWALNLVSENRIIYQP